ncbi:unnamed protein product, partial [Iphiclides podalirius]
MGLLNTVIGAVFGQYNSPILEVRVRDLLFDGIRICQSSGLIVGIVCSQIRAIGANSNNLVIQDDGSVVFSLLSYKELPSKVYKVHRGINDPEDLGRIISFNGSSHFDYWVDDNEMDGNETTASVCNMINGTDSGIFNPFISRDKPLYAINTDICRQVPCYPLSISSIQFEYRR